MKNLILISFLFFITRICFAQWFPTADSNKAIPNNIDWNKHTQKIISGSTTDPQSASVTGGAGSIIMKTSGDVYVKKDAGNTKNWKKFLDESTNLLAYIPTASSTQNGILTSTDWTTFNGKQDALGFTPENVLNKGVALGYAPLDGASKIPWANLPSAIMAYQGSWDPLINSPALSDGTGTNGNVYWVTASKTGTITGLTDSSMYNFQIGNLLVYSGALNKWQQVSPANGVQSVNTLQGAINLTANNPLSWLAGQVSISQATTATDGYLSSTDWNTFNGKENVLTFNSPLSRSVNAVSIHLATTATNGYLSSTDWNTFNNKADDISAITKDVSGFYDPSSVNVSYDTALDKITITGDTTVYWRGKPIVTLPSGWTSPSHPAGSGTWFLYYDGATGTTTWSIQPWTFDKVQIALAFDQSYGHFGLREPHGTMPQLVHQELHSTIGTYLSSGGDLSDYTTASLTDTARRPNISAATINDEDIPTVNAALTSKLYTRFALTGTASTASLTTDHTEIVNVNGKRPYYNQFTGGSWTQTPMTNNAYQAIFVMALPVTSDAVSQKYRYIFVQGQTESTTLATIQALSSSSVNLNGFIGSAPEFAFIAKIIIQYVGSPSNDWRLTSVEKLTGTKIAQASSTGNWLSSVSTDANFSGDGTTLAPLALSASITAPVATLTGSVNAVTKYAATGITASSMTDTGTMISTTSSLTTSSYQYFGDSGTDGTIRQYLSGGALIFEKRVSGSYTEIFRLDNL